MGQPTTLHEWSPPQLDLKYIYGSLANIFSNFSPLISKLLSSLELHTVPLVSLHKWSDIYFLRENHQNTLLL